MDIELVIYDEFWGWATQGSRMKIEFFSTLPGGLRSCPRSQKELDLRKCGDVDDVVIVVAMAPPMPRKK